MRKFHAIPFVSKSGKLSIHTLYLWKAYPEQVFMSVVSTVYRRLLCLHWKRFHYVRRRDLNNLLKVSIVFVITKDSWLIDRFLGMNRTGTSKKAVTNFVHFCVSQLDGDKRFVYSQAYKQANWLKFQVLRPSDKSREIAKYSAHLKKNFEDAHLPSAHDASIAFQISVDFWRVDRLLAVVQEDTHHASDSEIPDNLSELASRIAGMSEDSDW